MSTTTVPSLENVVPSSSPSVLKEDPSTTLEPEMKLELGRPPFEVTSNIRQGSCTPEPPSIDEQETFLRRPLNNVADDPLFRLPPPDLAPRFVFRPNVSHMEDTPPLLMTDDSSDSPPHVQTPIYTPSSPPPRIYFASSAITFVPPVSYDFLERDPNVKGVPRNYRAWARAGRPKLDLEGAERPDAKDDFRAMGRIFPQDSGSEEDGDEVDVEKKKKRKKRLMMKATAPVERPRRTLRKLLEGAPPSTPSCQTNVTIDKGKKIEPVFIQKENGAKEWMTSKYTEASESSGRGSSSTLLDPDFIQASKRKCRDSDKDNDEILGAKKLRVSKRLHTKKYGPQLGMLSESNSEEERDLDYSPSTDPRAPAAPAIIPSRRIIAEHRRSSSPPPNSILRARTGIRRSPKPLTPGSSRSAPLPTSRPGHRISRDAFPNLPQSVPIRTFPPSHPIIPGYPGFYRRYPFITQFNPDDPVGKYIIPSDTQPKRALGNWNPPRDYRDLYTPRYTKGTGGKKIALCPICYEDTSRGGEGRQEWNHTKTSQHNYHMQYYHGISATRCAPFSPPIAQRVLAVPRPQTNEKLQILQGKCHVCTQWIALEGCKLGELKVKELLWWKHAAQCHKDSKLPGEEDFFVEDDVFHRFSEYEAAHPEQV